MWGKDLRKRNVLSRKMVKEGDDWMSNGKEFQRTNAATGNERRATVNWREGGTWSSCVDDQWCDHTSQVEIVVYRPTHCAVTPLVYSRSEGLPGHRCLHLERSAGGCDFRSITVSVQTTPEDSSVPPPLSEHMCYLNFVFTPWQWS